MIEVEVKLPISDKEKLIKDLATLGFAEGETVKEIDAYYTSDFYDMKKRDEALRVREIENLSTGNKTAVLTHKGAKMDAVSMTRKELETEIGDANIGRQILEAVGFHAVPLVEKIRTSYIRENMTACVDTVTGLGDYLELEILSEPKEKEAALVKIENMLHKLGYSMEDTTRRSYLFMLMGDED